jgi:hypothetical protein
VKPYQIPIGAYRPPNSNAKDSSRSNNQRIPNEPVSIINRKKMRETGGLKSFKRVPMGNSSRRN